VANKIEAQMRQRLSIDVLKHELRLAAFSGCEIEPDTGSPSPADVDRIDQSTAVLFENLDDLRECALLNDPMFSPEHAVASRIQFLFRELGETDGEAATRARSTPLNDYAARAARIITNACET
jgi:hypothetical protein